MTSEVDDARKISAQHQITDTRQIADGATVDDLLYKRRTNGIDLRARIRWRVWEAEHIGRTANRQSTHSLPGMNAAHDGELFSENAFVIVSVSGIEQFPGNDVVGGDGEHLDTVSLFPQRPVTGHRGPRDRSGNIATYSAGRADE